MKGLVFVLILLGAKLFAQYDTIIQVDSAKWIKVFVTLKNARKVNPDSVFGLWLPCEGLKKWPKEILRYKNLEFLSFVKSDWSEPIVYNKILPNRLKKKRKRLERRMLKSIKGNHWSLDIKGRDYKPNKIKRLPESIGGLKKLKYLEIFDIGFDYDYLPNLQKILPNALISPNWESICEIRKDIRNYFSWEEREQKKFKREIRQYKKQEKLKLKEFE